MAASKPPLTPHSGTAPGAPAEGAVCAEVLDIIAETTGYSRHFLAADQLLDVDLCLDIAPRRQILAAVQRRFLIRCDREPDARDFPAISDLIQFVYEHRPDLAGADREHGARNPKEQPERDAIRDSVFNIIAEKSGSPVDMLDSALEWDADLGIGRLQQAEIAVVACAAFDISRDRIPAAGFRTLQDLVEFLCKELPRPATHSWGGPLGTPRGELGAAASGGPAPLSAGVKPEAPARSDFDCRVTIRTVLDPTLQPFLHDYALDGAPALPAAAGLEAIAEVALAVVPGLRIAAMEDLEFKLPFTFYNRAPRAVFIVAELRAENRGIFARCRLAGERILPLKAEMRAMTKLTGAIHLSSARTEPAGARGLVELRGMPVEAADIYRVCLYGPACQVLKRAWLSDSAVVGEMAPGLPAYHHFGDMPLVAAPRLIELCFQTAGIWEIAVEQRIGLPRHIDSLWLDGDLTEAAGPFYAVAKPDRGTARFDIEVTDAAGICRMRLSGYSTRATGGMVDPRALFPTRTA